MWRLDQPCEAVQARRCPKSPVRVKQQPRGNCRAAPAGNSAAFKRPIAAHSLLLSHSTHPLVCTGQAPALPEPVPTRILPGITRSIPPGAAPLSLHGIRGCFLSPAGRTVWAIKHVTFRKQRSLPHPGLKYPWAALPVP